MTTLIRNRTETSRLIIPQLARFYAKAIPVAYAVQRVAIGGTLMTHGLPKLTGSAHGSMANPMAGSINLIANKLHLPAAEQLGAFVAYLETFGGLALAVGLLTRIVAPMFAVQMACICLALGQTLAAELALDRPWHRISLPARPVPAAHCLRRRRPAVRGPFDRAGDLAPADGRSAQNRASTARAGHAMQAS